MREKNRKKHEARGRATYIRVANGKEEVREFMGIALEPESPRPDVAEPEENIRAEGRMEQNGDNYGEHDTDRFGADQRADGTEG